MTPEPAVALALGPGDCRIAARAPCGNRTLRRPSAGRFHTIRHGRLL